MAETMQANIHWQGDSAFSGTTGSGHSLDMDGPPDHGGRNRGPRPMETLLLGMGACASFDVVDILKRGRQQISGCEAEVRAERADEVPAVFTRICLHFKVTGSGLEQRRVARAIELSAEKYCSASIMLRRGGVQIEHSFELIEE